MTAVGPILSKSAAARAVIAAIRELNHDAIVIDRGGYVRVSAPGRCVLTRQAVEEHLGAPFSLPGDLERIMPSFRGAMTLSGEQVEWRSGG